MNPLYQPTPNTPQKKLQIEPLGPLQLRVMQYIWKSEGGCTASQVHTDLNNVPHAPQLAYTTILTVMRSLAKREYLNQQNSQGRSHVFSVLIGEEDYCTNILAGVLVNDFRNDKTKLLETLDSITCQY